MTESQTQKQALLEEHLNRPAADGMAMILVNMAFPGVIAPASLMTAQAGVPFKISYRSPAAPTLSDDGVMATLSFSRQPFECFFPWDSIFGITMDSEASKGWCTFVDSAPPAIRQKLEAEIAGKSRAVSVGGNVSGDVKPKTPAPAPVAPERAAPVQSPEQPVKSTRWTPRIVK